eukprot:3600219-Prymnesium_polylepis.1
MPPMRGGRPDEKAGVPSRRARGRCPTQQRRRGGDHDPTSPHPATTTFSSNARADGRSHADDSSGRGDGWLRPCWSSWRGVLRRGCVGSDERERERGRGKESERGGEAKRARERESERARERLRLRFNSTPTALPTSTAP